MYPYIIQGSNIVVVIDNKNYTITTSHSFYKEILEGIKSNDWETVREYVNPKKSLVNYSKGSLFIVDDEFFWNGKPFHNALCSRLLEMHRQKFDIEPMINFIENLKHNPSNRAVEELYRFLEANTLPITEDGCFLAYKKVREDWLDVHSGTISNHIGAEPEMPRNEVDDDPNRTCSHGLHVCSEGYLKHFSGDRTVIVKVNPADVVAIPRDYNNSKMRVCKYKVIGELNVPADKAFSSPVESGEEYVNPVDMDSDDVDYNSGYDYDDPITG